MITPFSVAPLHVSILVSSMVVDNTLFAEAAKVQGLTSKLG